MQARNRSIGIGALAACLVVLLVSIVTMVSLFVGAAGSAEDAYREITVELENFAFKPSQYVVMPGEKIRFLVKNPSTGWHTFSVMRSKDDREKPLVDADAPPRQDQVIELTMPDEEIELFLVCLPHETLGMVGSIVVTANPERIAGESGSSGSTEK